MNTSTKWLTALFVLGTAVVLAGPSPADPAASQPAPAQSALTTLLARPNSPLPAGTRLLSLRVVDGLATANFSHELRDNFQGGDSAEALTVNSVLRTLGQFPTISRVQLLVEGQRVDSLGGLLEISDPLPVIRSADRAAPAQLEKRWLHRKPHGR